METSSIPQLSDLLKSRITLIASKSRRLTSSLVGRVVSPEPKEALQWSASTTCYRLALERTSPSAPSTASLVPREQDIENSQCSRREVRFDLYSTA